MRKLWSMMSAVALAGALGGFAFAADNDQQNSEPNREPKAQSVPVDDPAAGGATATQAYQEYLVELKNCEPLSGAEREACIEAARKKHGQM